MATNMALEYARSMLGLGDGEKEKELLEKVAKKALSKIDGSTACKCWGSVKQYADELFRTGMHMVHSPSQLDILVHGPSSSATMIGLGSALLAAPILKKNWPTYVLWILPAFLGGIGCNEMLKDERVISVLPSDTQQQCAVNAFIVVLGAVLVGGFALYLFDLALFVVGTAAGGYGMSLLVGMLAPVLKDQGYDIDDAFGGYAWVVVPVTGLVSGFVLPGMKDKLIDTIAGVVGAMAVSEGVMMLLSNHVQLAQAMSLDAHYSYYSMGLVGVLIMLRSKLA